VYDKYKTALVSDPRHRIALVDFLRPEIPWPAVSGFQGRRKSTHAIQWLGSDTCAVFLLSHIIRVFDFTYFSRSQRSNFEIFMICSNALIIGWIFTEFLSWIHLIRIYHILPWFLVWPTFQCHRGQTLFFYYLPLNNTLTIECIFTKYLFMVTSNKDASHIALVFDLILLFNVTDEKLWNFLWTLMYYRSQVCDLTSFSRLQAACSQPLPGNELLNKTCNVTQFFTVTYPSAAHILLTQSLPCAPPVVDIPPLWQPLRCAPSAGALHDFVIFLVFSVILFHFPFRYGKEDKLVTIMGVMQALVSFIQDSKDNIRCIIAGDHQFVFLVREHIILVCVSKTSESTTQILLRLTYVYNQIISVLTYSQLARIFKTRRNYDLRRLLSGTEKFIDNLLNLMDHDPSFLLGAVRCLPLPNSIRETIAQTVAMHAKVKVRMIHYVVSSCRARSCMDIIYMYM
jgi:hypothetical protein